MQGSHQGESWVIKTEDSSSFASRDSLYLEQKVESFVSKGFTKKHGDTGEHLRGSWQLNDASRMANWLEV
jgi:hypothetical protein